MSMKMIGDWQKVTAVTSALKNEMNAARKVSLAKFASKARTIAITHITKQDLNWEALSKKYLDYKVANNDSNLIYVKTNSYKPAINAWSTHNTAFAGVRKAVKHPDGTEYSKIAAVLEFGNKSKTIPARPLWRPTFKETKKWYFTGVATPDAIFKNRMKKRFGAVTPSKIKKV